MPLKQSVKPFLSHRKSVCLILILTLALIIGGIFFNSGFSIRDIEIIGGSQDILIHGLDEIKSTNIVFLSEKNEQLKLLDLNPNIREIEIVKKYPHRLIISVSFQLPLAALQTNSGLFIVDESGHILRRTKTNNTSNIPDISYYQKLDYDSYAPGDIVGNKDILASLQFLKKAQELGLQVNSIDIKGFGMIALHVGVKNIYFSLEKNVNAQIFQFETVIRQFRVEGRSYSELDFRFDKPVVTN